MAFTLFFDDIILKQLKRAAKNNHVKVILTKMLDRIESLVLMLVYFLIQLCFFMK